MFSALKLLKVCEREVHVPGIRITAPGVAISAARLSNRRTSSVDSLPLPSHLLPLQKTTEALDEPLEEEGAVDQRSGL